MLAAREEFELGLDLKSDCKSLKEVVLKLFSAGIKAANYARCDKRRTKCGAK